MSEAIATTFVAELGVVEDRCVSRARYDVDAAGSIVWAGSSDDTGAPAPAERVRDFGRALVVPGMVDAHSHAFQRAIRGTTHARAIDDPSDFWSWRTAMYHAATTLDPAGVYAITRRAYAEMLAAGITCVGEFHYLHHQPDGRPYDDANELSWQVVRAADDVGIRLVLLEVFYARAGAGKPALPEQRRFCDRDVDAYAARIQALRAAGVRVGIAPHSVRAVDRPALAELAVLARGLDVPVHVHVSEQPRENEECLAEHGCSPMQLLADVGLTARPHAFTAVHAVYTSTADHAALAGQHVCACPSTEADLGDGILPAGELRAAGTRLALGSDSNAIIDLIQEARLLEMGERLRTRRRVCLAPDERSRSLGLALAAIASEGGASSLGWRELGRLAPGHQFDAAVVDLGHPLLAGVPARHVLDATWSAGHAGLVIATVIGGRECG